MCSFEIRCSNPNKAATLPGFLSSFPITKPHGKFHLVQMVQPFSRFSERRNTRLIRIDERHKACDDLNLIGQSHSHNLHGKIRSVHVDPASYYILYVTYPERYIPIPAQIISLKCHRTLSSDPL